MIKEFHVTPLHLGTMEIPPSIVYKKDVILFLAYVTETTSGNGSHAQMTSSVSLDKRGIYIGLRDTP